MELEKVESNCVLVNMKIYKYIQGFVIGLYVFLYFLDAFTMGVLNLTHKGESGDEKPF